MNTSRQRLLTESYPERAAQWHPTKNGDLTPMMVTCGSHIKVWWLLSYDDPETGERFEFEWEEEVQNRIKGPENPFVSGYRVWPGYNDLKTRHPDLAAQWHPTNNGTLTPENVTAMSNRKVWWLMPYDDPDTGEHFDFEWEARVCNRIKSKGCPILSGKIAWPGFNDLATKRPDLAAQWHPTKNGKLKPEMVTCGNGMKTWWLYSYDDPDTGKQVNLEWSARVCDRVRWSGCPLLLNQNVQPGVNDLDTKLPDLAAQWHPTKNGTLTPDMITCGYSKEVWWFLPYDDLETGEHFDFEWKQTIRSRKKWPVCPILSGKIAWPGFNDLASQRPDLATQWHPTKNGTLTPEMVTCGSGKRVWWVFPYDDPETGKHFEFEWSEQVTVRVKWSGCPVLTGRIAWPGFNDLATKRPELAKEWHPTKNGDLTPEMVTCGSSKKVWWFLPYDDPETGKHFDFEWSEQVCERVKGYGCPFLSGHAVWPGFNDLATTRPDLAREWHPTKNGAMTPEMVTCNSDRKVWWTFPYDDPVTDEHFEFDWEEQVSNRNKGCGCPVLSGHIVWPGFNDLATKRPDLAAQWHPIKNGKLTPEMVTCGSGRMVWWYLPYDDSETGKHHDFEWRATICSRSDNASCPYLSGKDVWPGFNDLATKRPDLAAQWHPIKNGKLTPEMVTCGSEKKVWWLYPYDDLETGEHYDFEWRTSVTGRRDDKSCPYLTGRAVWPGFNDLATKRPDLAAQWHPTKNGKLTPEMVTCGSEKKVWWLYPYDDLETGEHYDFEWRTSVAGRRDDKSCPYLTGHAVWPGYNDLSSCYPLIAREWHPSKNRKKEPDKVYKETSKKAWWKCHKCRQEWYASVKGRTREGVVCPVCRKTKTRY